MSDSYLEFSGCRTTHSEVGYICVVESHSYEPHLLSLAEISYYHFYFAIGELLSMLLVGNFLIEHLFFYILDFLQETKLESNWSIVNNEERHISPTPFCPSVLFFGMTNWILM